MEPIKIGIGVSSIGRFLPLIGKAAGLFERESIPVEIVNQRDEERAVPDIVSGATPIGTPNAPSLIFSVLDGSDIVIIGGVLNRPAFYLAAGPNVETVADLKGKRVGINEPKRMAGMVMLALLRKWGFVIERDLKVVDSGVNDRSYEVLLEKKIDAALLPPEKAFLAEALGLRIIADSLDLDCHWVPLATTRRFLRENRDTAQEDCFGICRERPLVQKPAAGNHQGNKPSPSGSRRPSGGRREVLPPVCRRVRADLGAIDKLHRVDTERGRVAGSAG